MSYNNNKNTKRVNSNQETFLFEFMAYKPL